MTEEARPRPPEGWYPDPEDARYLRWWNGHQWELRKPVPGPGGSPGNAPVPVGRGFARLGGAIGVLLGLTMLASIGQLALAAWGLSMIDDAVASGDLASLERYDGIDATLSILVVLCLLPTGVLWMIWQYRLARSTHPGEVRRGPGMHAFSWIIPVVAAWFPYQNVKDLWTLLAPGKSLVILRWWWAAWIVAQVLDRIFLASYDETESVGDVKGIMTLEGVSAAVGLLAAALAVRIVRRLTTGGLQRSAGAPVTPADSSDAW